MAFLTGDRVRICPDYYKRETKIVAGDAPFRDQGVSCVYYPPGYYTPTPPGSPPKSEVGEWVSVSYPILTISAGNIEIYSGGQFFTEPTCNPSFKESRHFVARYKGKYITKRSAIKLDFSDAMADLRDNYPASEGWRVARCLPRSSYLRDGENFDDYTGGTRVMTDDEYEDYVTQKYGEGHGASGGYSGAVENENSAIEQRISDMHQKGDGTPDSDDNIVIEPGGNVTYDESDDDRFNSDSNVSTEPQNPGLEPSLSGIQDGVNGWTVQTFIDYSYHLGIWYRVYHAKKYLPDQCFSVYMERPGETNQDNVGVMENETSNSNTARTVSDIGNYSSAIDGGVNDRSNGHRFVGTSYQSLYGFYDDGRVFWDSLFAPTTTRWGETLDLTDPDTTYNGRTLGYGFVAGRGDFLSYNITIESIENNMSSHDIMTFVENIKYDESGANVVHTGTANSKGDKDGNVAGNAFNWLYTDFWECYNNDAWLEYDFGEDYEQIINSYVIRANSSTDSDHNPKTWTLQAKVHENADTWTTLDTQTDYTSWTADKDHVFTFTNSTKYRYYRLVISDTIGGEVEDTVRIVQLELRAKDTWDVGDWVYGVAVCSPNPKTLFAGQIVNKERTIDSGQQIVRYTAHGMTKRLEDLGFAFEVVFTDKTIKEMAELITDNIPPAVVADVEGLEKLPNTVIPDINWTCVNYKQALDMLMDKSGHFGYYIDYKRVLHFVNLKYDSSEDADAGEDVDIDRKRTYAIPSEGDSLLSTHYVKSHNMTVDVTAAKTRCVAVGDYPKLEITEDIPVVTDDSGVDPPYAIKVAKTNPLGEQDNIIDTYFVVLSHNRIQSQLLSDEEKAIEVRVHYQQSRYGNVTVHNGWYNPLTNPFNFVDYNEYAAFNINVYRPVDRLKVTYVYKAPEPMKADTGWMGTAYTEKRIQNTMLILDARFQQHVLGDKIVRNDAEDLKAYAQQLIEPYMDWYVGGNVVLDGLRTEIEMDDFINFGGTKYDWTSINAYIKTVTYNFKSLETTLELTNNFYLGSGILDPQVAESTRIIKDSEELQRVLNRLKLIELGQEQF